MSLSPLRAIADRLSIPGIEITDPLEPKLEFRVPFAFNFKMKGLEL
jgi:hypothetical protein